LKANQIQAEIHTLLGQTRTVEEAVEELNIDAHRIIKTIVMISGNGQPLIAYVLGDRKVSYPKLRKIIGADSIRLASTDEVREITGYQVGAVPPVGHKKLVRCFMDQEILELEFVTGGGGAIDRLLTIKTKDIVRVINPEICEISK
jgi:Cys-tRNA(Pro) deacylase